MRRAVLRPESEKSGSAPAQHRARQGEALGIALRGLALDLRPARIAEAEELRDLVEGLADRVVDRGAEPDVVADALHGDELGVAAGGEEQQVGKGDAVRQARGERMRLEVVDGHERLAGRRATGPWRW